MMKRFLFHPLSFVALLFIVMLGAWISYFPVLVSGRFAQSMSSKTGRSVQVQNGAGYVLSPIFGISLNDVSIAGASALAAPVVKAKQLIIPISFGQIVTSQFSTDSLILNDADIVAAINGQGHSNVLIELDPSTAKTDARAEVAKPLAVTVTNSHFRFSDERNNSGFALEQVSGDAQFLNDGGLSLRATAALNSQFITIDATLGSLARSLAEGSPLDFNIEGVASALAFSGRLATTGSLNLAGQADLSSTDAPRLLRWLGADIKGLDSHKSLALSGALDSEGSVFNFRNASITYGTFEAKGDITLAAGKLRPSINTTLAMDVLDLNAYKTNSFESGSDWSEQLFDFSDLAAIDAQFSITAQKLKYKSLVMGPSSMTGSLKDKVLGVALKGTANSGGTAGVGLDLDATQTAAKFNLLLDLKDVAAEEFLGALFNIKFISGQLGLVGDMKSSGANAASLISNMDSRLTASLENGALLGADLHSTLIAAANPLEGWIGQTTPVVHANVEATISQGVATLGDAQIEGANVSLRSTGEIDLLRKALDLNIVAKNQPPLKITGPWSKPKIELK